MVLVVTPSHAQRQLADHVRARRLAMELTQEGLASRSGVPLSTLRKFEQKSEISLEAFLKLLLVVGGMEEIVKALEPQDAPFRTIDDVLKAEQGKQARKRGRRG
ncbi:helix-turn-helix protein [Breoghania corrubedonensis]|uniref:Helix-turn-helix protein n=1 Tax=Breoghania corrubedonensis TaxID=665038 RepID=A0A2T5VD56_9HYPH|nr:helix-turn-helix transcriptional regulator [Breoghania corrubedonensis]PTW61681.1 helix-turn-helix protein [Breoghania corrubedonensis]